MSNLDNLTSKIIEDAKKNADNIIAEAKEKESQIIEKKKKEAEKSAQNVIEKAKLEGKNLFDRAISKTELKVRNEKLVAKQTVINKVFSEAVKELNAMNKEQFLSYVKDQIKSLPISGEQNIIVASKDKEKITSEFLNELNKELKNVKIILSEETREINGGFILSKDGIEINCSFADVIDSLRYDLENEVANMLFN